MADWVLSELAGQSGRVVLVIDDVHELNCPEALPLLARLLADLPSHAHAIVSTRRDLPLRLHELRLAGELAEIRAADLRFSECETGELLAASGIALSEAGTALLQQRTEGWARGCGWRRCRWPVTLTRSVSPRSSPAATARSRSTRSARCWTASLTGSGTCCCAPVCSTRSTASWLI
jgi:hypothetical protein